MKYMLMMFGSSEGLGESASPEWIREMIGFMIQIDKDLVESGEMVFNAGLADGSTAKTVRMDGGLPVATDGPFAEAKESLIGFWIVDVASEERVVELAGSIAKYSGLVEVRRVEDAPPEM
jgi:hypothetical protein